MQAVNSPLHYGIIVTRQKSMAMIGFVWFMAAILSAPVWAGSVRLVQLQSTYSSVVLSGSINNNNGSSSSSYTSSASDWDQQHLMDLCYSISLILFGFVWPLAALCWLYLRMYEAALKNSARTRRQSLCSNPTPADTTVVQHGGGNGENGPAAGSCPSLADALTSAGAAATVAAQSQTSANLLIAAAAAAAAAASSNNNSNSNRARRRDNRCVCCLRLCPFFLSFSHHDNIKKLAYKERSPTLRSRRHFIFIYCDDTFMYFAFLFGRSINPSFSFQRHFCSRWGTLCDQWCVRGSLSQGLPVLSTLFYNNNGCIGCTQ